MTAYNLSDENKDGLDYISTDGFLDFRAWIVSLGKVNYDTFLNFKSEAELLQFDLDVESAYREDLVHLASTIAEELGENIDLDFHTDNDVDELYLKMNWDGLNEKHPKLFKLYQV